MMIRIQIALACWLRRMSDKLYRRLDNRNADALFSAHLDEVDEFDRQCGCDHQPLTGEGFDKGTFGVCENLVFSKRQ